MSPSLVRERLLASLPGRLLLRLLCLPYGAAVLLRNFLYNIGLAPARKLDTRTICIGNITAGGTGKTTAVLLAAQTLSRKQIKPAILSRGYGRLRKTRKVQVLLNTQNVHWEETGDEPWMMHRALKGMSIPILIHSNRTYAGETAIFYYNPGTLLLDDGFQHRALRRDVDIVLISALDPFGGGHLLPYGDLREPVRSLNRADLVVVTHSDQVPAGKLAAVRERVAEIAPEVPVAEASHRPDFFLDVKSDRRRRLSYLRNKPVCCFSATGNPRSFEDLLRRVGVRLVQVWRYPDHHPYAQEDLKAIEDIRAGMPVITTFKDFPRLPPGWQETLTGEVLLFGVRLEITKGKSLWENALCGEARRSSEGTTP